MNFRKNRQVVAFKTAAERYCKLIESEPSNGESWAAEVLVALSSLYAAGHALPECEPGDNIIPDDLKLTMWDRNAVWQRVREYLGRRNHWIYFELRDALDSRENPEPSLISDDLVDVYRYVVPGLRAWEALGDEYMGQIVFDWKDTDYLGSWSCHAASAIHALHVIVTNDSARKRQYAYARRQRLRRPIRPGQTVVRG